MITLQMFFHFTRVYLFISREVVVCVVVLMMM